MTKNAILFSGTSNPALARALARALKIPLGIATIKKFRDGETYVNIERATQPKWNVADKRVVVLQSGAPAGNEAFVELLLMLDALYRLHPKELIVVLPFFPYRRQERKVESGEAVSAAVVARTIEHLHADHVVAVDLHVEKIRDFFSIPCVNVRATQVFVDYFTKLFVQRRKKRRSRFLWHGDPWAVVAPDLGSRTSARTLAEQLNIAFVQSYKHRHEHDVVEIDVIEGGVQGKQVILLDDEINTAGTMIENARVLRKKGAEAVYVAATHGIFAAGGLQRLHAVPYIREIIVTDTIAQPHARQYSKLRVLPITPVLARALQRLV